MRVLAYVHMYPPAHNAGAELMLHTMMRDLVRKGHETRVLVSRGDEQQYVHEGVVCSKVISRDLAKWFRWSDVAITHLDQTRSAILAARGARTPLVHIVHNDRQLRFHRVSARDAALVVMNSRWIADAVAWPGPSMVLPPPVIAEDYRTTPGNCVTLVNLSASKGAEVFYELAARRPEREFLGVRGSYGKQLVAPDLPNLTIIDNTPDMRAVYSRTRVLLMPSDYESWGRVAIEAAASGIPTLAHPTPGLLEALGPAGMFCDRAKIDEWEWALDRLEIPEVCEAAAERARARSEELDPTRDLLEFETKLKELV